MVNMEIISYYIWKISLIFFIFKLRSIYEELKFYYLYVCGFEPMTQHEF